MELRSLGVLEGVITLFATIGGFFGSQFLELQKQLPDFWTLPRGSALGTAALCIICWLVAGGAFAWRISTMSQIKSEHRTDTTK